MNLEELLPELRNGAKIRLQHWGNNEYIHLDENGIVCNERNKPFNFVNSEIFSNVWELYQESQFDWDYIIKNKCLCWFWDDKEEENKHIGILKELKKYETYKFSIITPDNYVNDVSFTNCRPVRKDEVTFYEDKKDD